jgi:hypothetical protein
MPQTPIEEFRTTIETALHVWDVVAQDPKYLSESNAQLNEKFADLPKISYPLPPAQIVAQMDELLTYLQIISLPYVELALAQEGIWGILNLDGRWYDLIQGLLDKYVSLNAYEASQDGTLPIYQFGRLLRSLYFWSGKTFFATFYDTESIRTVLQSKNDCLISYALNGVLQDISERPSMFENPLPKISARPFIAELVTLGIERHFRYVIKKRLLEAPEIATQLLIEHLKNVPKENIPYMSGFEEIGQLLESLGESALHALLAEYSREPSEEIRGNLICGLVAFADYPDIVLSFMADILANEGRKLRSAMLQTLKDSAWYKHSTRIAPFIIDQLQDEDFGICMLALDIVYWWGFSGDIRHIAQEQIIELAKDEHHPASYFAIAIAGSFNDPSLIPLFLEIFLSNTDWKRRRNAILALYETKPTQQIVIDTLLDAFPKEDSYMQGEILDWLQNMGVSHAQLIPHYLTLLQTEEILNGLREIARTLVDWLDEDAIIIPALREQALQNPEFRSHLMYFLNNEDTPSAQAFYNELLQSIDSTSEEDAQ